MRLTTPERVLWSACFAARYGKEQARGVPRTTAAATAAVHATNALEAVRAIPVGKLNDDERAAVNDVLGREE